MGAISDVGNEAVIDKIERITDFELQLLWKDMEGITRYVLANYYRYWDVVSDWDLAWSDEIAAVTIRMAQDMIAPWLEGLQETIEWQMATTLHIEGSFWDFILAELGIRYNETYSTYTWIAGGWKSQIDSRIKVLEEQEDRFTQTELDKLFFIVDNFEHLKALVEGDIELIIQRVLDEVRPEITSQINTAIAPFDKRLQTVETALGKTQFWFIDVIIEIWGFLIGGSIIPIPDIEAAMEIITKEFEAKIDEAIKPVRKDMFELAEILADLLINITGIVRGIVITEVSKINTLTAGQTAQVSNMIAAAVTGIGGGIGPPGPQGPPGQMGPMGPIGPVGPAGEGTEYDINKVNRQLYEKLWNASAITTSNLTGVVDWMLQTYGERFGDLQGQLTPITEFFTEEMKTDLSGLVDKFGSPEAIITFLIPESEGQETEVLDLMQILIRMTFDRGMI